MKTKLEKTIEKLSKLLREVELGYTGYKVKVSKNGKKIVHVHYDYLDYEERMLRMTWLFWQLTKAEVVNLHTSIEKLLSTMRERDLRNKMDKSEKKDVLRCYRLLKNF